IEESWRIVSKILDPETPPLEYEPGSWGPEAAAGMAGEDGWHAPAKQLFVDGEIQAGAPTGSMG
ncbi:MAG: glucose-6-phosphate dehydrogenase, partial [Catenulispora sp.]|nr:glucose-6-phosphate dehydrogenase [Catenulispora sp.]